MNFKVITASILLGQPLFFKLDPCLSILIDSIWMSVSLIAIKANASFEEVMA